MTFSNNVKTVTNEKLVPKVIDTILNSSPFTLRILGNQKRWVGTKMKFPIKYQSNDQGLSFDGLDKFNTAKVDTRINMEFSPTGYTIPVVISNMETDVNATDEGVLNQLRLETASVAQDMANDIGGLFFAYKTASSKKFLGVYDAADDGNTTATYGGLTRSSYSSCIVGTVNSSTGALTAAKMRTTLNGCVHGNDRPSMIVTTKAVFGYYEALVEAKVSANYSTNGFPQLTRTGVAPGVQALKGQLGFDVVYFAGIPVVVDELCDAGYMVFVNENHLAFYGLKSQTYKPISFATEMIEGVYSQAPTTTGFAWSGLMEPLDQYGRVGHIILMGDLISDSPRHLGLRTGVTS